MVRGQDHAVEDISNGLIVGTAIIVLPMDLGEGVCIDLTDHKICKQLNMTDLYVVFARKQLSHKGEDDKCRDDKGCSQNEEDAQAAFFAQLFCHPARQAAKLIQEQGSCSRKADPKQHAYLKPGHRSLGDIIHLTIGDPVKCHAIADKNGSCVIGQR